MQTWLWLECGGSRCQGLFGNRIGRSESFATSHGFNATTDGAERLKSVLEACRHFLKEQRPEHVYVGLAGLRADLTSGLSSSLSDVWPESRMQVFSDLEALGRVHARPAIVGILGTGASAAVWDGNKIIARGPSLGWILGDEGSGAWLGKSLLRDRFYGLMPQEFRVSFDHFTGSEIRQEVLQKVYNAEGRRWLAGLSRWLAFPEVRASEWAQLKLREGFQSYFQYQVNPLLRVSRSSEFVIAGGIAWHFRDELMTVTRTEGLNSLSVYPSATAYLESLSSAELLSRLGLGTN